MANQDEKWRETLQKKSLPEIEALISASKVRMSEEKDLIKLAHLNTELSMLKEVREKKIGAHQMHKTAAAAKPALKSFDDYIKSKR